LSAASGTLIMPLSATLSSPWRVVESDPLTEASMRSSFGFAVIMRMVPPIEPAQ